MTEVASVAAIADDVRTLPAGPEPVGFRFSDSLATLVHPSSPRSEAVGALRTHLIAQHIPAGRRSLALCSPTADIGCTALAVELAITLAESGLKTLLIDADLRRPAVHRFITPSREVPGLRQCLGDRDVTFGEAIQPDVAENLSVLYAGGRSDRAQELLAAPQFPQVIDLCLRDFDFTVIDTPPSSTSADARRIAGVAGYAMIAVGRDRTFVSDVKVLAEELAGDGAVVIGTVLIQP